MQNEQLHAVSEQLSQAVIKYEDLYDFAPVGYVTLDEHSLILEANLTSSRLLCEDRRTLLITRFTRLFVPEHFNLFTGFLKNLRESETKQTCELTLLRPDNTILEVRLEGIVFMPKTPEFLQFRIAIIDISEQKAAERKMRQSQEFVEKIAETIPDILTVYDLDTQKFVYANRETETFLGLSPLKIQQMDMRTMLERVHPDDVKTFTLKIQDFRFLKDGEISEFEYRIKNAAGKYVWLRVRSVVFQRSVQGHVSQVLSVRQDITFKKNAEEELRFKNQIIDNLQENLPIVVSVIRPDGTFLNMTGSGLKSLEREGIPNLEGHNIFELFPDLRSELETVFQEGKKVSYVRCIGKESKTCFQNYVFLDAAQNAAISFSIDVSEQMAIEKAITAEREFSQSLLDNSVDGILAFDAELKFTSWNKVMEKKSGYQKEKIIGRQIFEIFPFFHDTEIKRALEKVLKGRRQVLYNQYIGVKAGIFEIYLNPLTDETGKIKGGLCVLHDVSFQKKLENESTQLKLDQQKTVLNAVLATQEEERRRIAEALHNGVGQMLYAAKLNLERNTFEKKDSVAMQRNLLDEAIREVRTISFELQPSILQDFGLETALNELMKRIPNHNLKINLYTSGLTRFSDELEIAAYRIIQELLNNIIKHANATVANLEITSQRTSLEIMAKDNGIGFDTKSKACKTKGIGLTSIQNRVKLLNGKMEIESEPGKGATISITLPLAKQNA